jgi:hypothetical protein
MGQRWPTSEMQGPDYTASRILAITGDMSTSGLRGAGQSMISAWAPVVPPWKSARVVHHESDPVFEAAAPSRSNDDRQAARPGRVDLPWPSWKPGMWSRGRDRSWPLALREDPGATHSGAVRRRAWWGLPCWLSERPDARDPAFNRLVVTTRCQDLPEARTVVSRPEIFQNGRHSGVAIDLGLRGTSASLQARGDAGPQDSSLTVPRKRWQSNDPMTALRWEV